MTRYSAFSYENFEPMLIQGGFTILDLPLTGVNGNGDEVVIDVRYEETGDGNSILVWQTETMQKNGWVRINSYYPDNSVTERYKGE